MARYATYLDYGYTLNLMVAVSEREYRHLSPDVQQVLAESVEETGLYCTQLSKEQIAVDLQVLPEKHGLAVIHPNQEVWRTRFGAAIRELWSREGLAPALLAELQAV
jgi:TRAP-type C4-dicarboxylate transport system substrate-binding protein